MNDKTAFVRIVVDVREAELGLKETLLVPSVAIEPCRGVGLLELIVELLVDASVVVDGRPGVAVAI